MFHAHICSTVYWIALKPMSLHDCMAVRIFNFRAFLNEAEELSSSPVAKAVVEVKVCQHDIPLSSL